MDHHKDAVDSGRTREERQEADPFAPQNADAEKTRSEATEKAAGPHRPHARHAGHAPGTLAHRAERSYLAQVPTEQGRIIDEMV